MPRLAPLRPLALRCTTALTLAAAALPLAAQGAPRANITQGGPIIHSAGAAALVEDATFTAPDDHVYRIVWEINAGSDSLQSAQLGTIARFYNLHARHGVPLERLHAAAVVHGSGWIALLNDEAFAARYPGRTNPSRQLVQELVAAGAQLVVCGQTAAFRGVRKEEFLPGVKLAPSAMTALNVFHSQGYHLNPWR
jgi:intracellular sulfur oxidation DsrE/DsrF family protein